MNAVIAQSLKNKVIVTLQGGGPFRVERLKKGIEGWQVWDGNEFSGDSNAIPAAVSTADIIDYNVEDGLYTYRAVNFNKINPTQEDYFSSNWVRCGSTAPIGWSFDNYQPPPGQWGEICTPDDLRYTWIFGNDFKATNGQVFTDDQIRYFVDMAVAEMERRLNITIKKVRIKCNPDSRGLVKGQDYDIEEGLYEFSFTKIQKYGKIVTRKRPVIKLHGISLMSRYTAIQDLMDTTIVDKTKGILKLLKRPFRPTETSVGIQTALNPYGRELFNPFMFYQVDYDAGFETAADVPLDLRMAISKCAAIALLNSIGDGLMAGFSSSSLSMDGMSESFSSTQSATSAYFGARIQQYQKELEPFVDEARRKYGYIAIGSI